MKINNLKISNFKSLKGNYEISIDSNLVFFIGENNTGKTTLLEAISYLINGPEKELSYISNTCNEQDFVSVEAIIEDDFLKLGEDEDLKKYEKYIQEKDGRKFIQVKRSSEKKRINQGGKKEIDLNESKILMFCKDSNQFENPTGKDTTIKNLFDVVSVWSDTDPFDVTDFGASKILGKLVNSHAKEFFTSSAYEEFKKQHDNLFHVGDNSLQKQLETLSSKITQIFKDQYGDAKIDFNFNIVDNSSYIKNGSLSVDEQGDKTTFDEKGSGMKRSIALSIIQLYSNLHENGNNLIFLIDEPELSLHPKAQQKLIEALISISANTQVFITTHSPYSLKLFDNTKHALFVFNKSAQISIKKISDLKLIDWGPTFSEIDYFAYNIYSKELYNDLYGYLEYKVVSELGEKTLDNYLTEKKSKNLLPYNKLNNKTKNTTSIQYTDLTIIRHKIHHQENTHNLPLTQIEIQNGTEELISLIREII